jgi:hypothetical protein
MTLEDISNPELLYLLALPMDCPYIATILLFSPLQALDCLLVYLLDLFLPLLRHLFHSIMRFPQLVYDDFLAQLHLPVPLLCVASRGPYLQRRTFHAFLRLRGGLGTRLRRGRWHGDVEEEGVLGIWTRDKGVRRGEDCIGDGLEMLCL